MPLLTYKELADISPIFRGNAGNILARLLMRIFSVNSLNDLYDRNCSFQGEDFARAILNELNIKYSIAVRRNFLRTAVKIFHKE